MREHGMHADSYDFFPEVERFSREMDLGLSDGESSLLMAPAWLDAETAPPESGSAIAVDAGGTNLRVALARFCGKGLPVLEYSETFPTPGSQGEIDIEEFFGRIASWIEPVEKESDHVGICFSFPSEILPDRDSRIIFFDKELRVKNSANQRIAPGMNAAFRRLGLAEKQVTVLNDTTAALLGACVNSRPSTSKGSIGLIYGTGLNICYSERTDRIKKIGASLLENRMEHMLINTETGGYAGFIQGTCDKILDAKSVFPGEQRFEKMASGAYFGTLVLECLKLAGREGLFTTNAAALVNDLTRLMPAEVSDFMKSQDNGSTDIPPGNPLKAAFTEADDCKIAYAIIDILYDRVAKLLSIALTAIMLKSGGGTQEAPVFLAIEGSSYRKAHRFPERLERMLKANAGNLTCYQVADAHGLVLAGAAASVYF